MDLNQFDTRQKAEAGVDVPLIIEGETIIGDDGKPVTFKLKGLDDDAVHAHVMKSSQSTARTPAEVKEKDMKALRVAVCGWSGNFEVEGEKPKFSPAGIDAVFSNPVVRQAVALEIFDRANFMNGS